jgi:hypothetical protein
MNEEELRQFLIQRDALALFENIAEVISIFDSKGSGTLDEEDIKVTSPMMIMMLPLQF